MICAVVRRTATDTAARWFFKAIKEAGAEWLVITMPEEAAVLREEGVTGPILVLGPANLAQWRKAAGLDLSADCGLLYVRTKLATVSRERGVKMRLHIKADTGMNRVGVKTLEKKQTGFSIRLHKRTAARLEGLMTHFACADEADKTYTHLQNERFGTFIRLVREKGFAPIIHAANSGAALDCPQFAYDGSCRHRDLWLFHPTKSAENHFAGTRDVAAYAGFIY